MMQVHFSSPIYGLEVLKMVDNEVIFNKLVALENLSEAHFKVLLDNQNLILKNQEILSKQIAEINEKLEKL